MQLQYTLPLAIGGMYLIARQRTSEALYSFLVGCNAALEQWDSMQGSPTAECTGNILCERSGARHKADCWSQR
jgi:hypothetical protein